MFALSPPTLRANNHMPLANSQEHDKMHTFRISAQHLSLSLSPAWGQTCLRLTEGLAYLSHSTVVNVDVTLEDNGQCFS
jgi:hypothetical protein